MVAKELAYNIVIGGIRQSNVDLVFGSLNKDISRTQGSISDATERQNALNQSIREAKKSGQSYDSLLQQVEEVQKEIRELTEELSRQQESLRTASERTNKWGGRMQWATGIVTAATAALTALVHVQGEYSRSLINATQVTGHSVEMMERLNESANRLTGQGLSPETWSGIVDQMRQLQYQLKLGGRLTDEQELAYKRLDINPYGKTTVGLRNGIMHFDKYRLNYEGLQQRRQELDKYTMPSVLL